MADTIDYEKLASTVQNGTATKSTETSATTQAAAQTGGEFDYDAWQKRLTDTINRSKEVYGTPYTGDFNVGGVEGELGKQAIANYNTEFQAMQQQAARSGEGLQLASESTLAAMQRIDQLQNQVSVQYQSTLDSYGAAAEQAKEYAIQSEGKLKESLSVLDKIFTQINQDRDFSQAHAMQASAQSVLGSMKESEREIIQQYGTGSAEYQQFLAQKQVTLATAQSNIFASYRQLAEQQGTTYLNAVNETMWKQNMYTSFQEQQHVEMLKYMSDAKAGYAMQYAQLQIGMEQLKMAGMENLANWVIQTPAFMMANTPLITLLAELSPQPGLQAPVTNRRDIMGARAGGSRTPKTYGRI